MTVVITGYPGDSDQIATVDGIAVTGVGLGVGFTADASNTEVCVRPNNTDGVAHFGPDGSTRVIPESDSGLFFGSFLFSQYDLNENRWSGILPNIVDEMSAAGFGVEFSLYTGEEGGTYTPIQEFWDGQAANRATIQSNGPRQYPNIPWACPGDDFFRNPPVYIAGARSDDTLGLYFQLFADFWLGEIAAGAPRPYCLIYADEINAGYDGKGGLDPNNDSWPLQADMGGDSAMETVVAGHRDSGTDVPIVWGLLAKQGATSTPRPFRLNWYLPEIASGNAQNQDFTIPNRPPDAGSTLYSYWQSLQVAAMDRTPGFPWVAQASMSDHGGTMIAPGVISVIQPGMNPFCVGGQIPIALGLGACAVRFYVLSPYFERQAVILSQPVDTEGLQLFYDPGSAPYYAALAHSTLFHAYEKTILGKEVGVKYPGPSFFHWMRDASAWGFGKIWVCTNMTSKTETIQPNVIPSELWTVAKLIDQATVTSPSAATIIASGYAIPGRATLLLVL